MATVIVIGLILLLGLGLDRAYHAHRGQPAMLIGSMLFDIVQTLIVAIFVEQTLGTIDVIALNPRGMLFLLELLLFAAAIARANFYRSLRHLGELIRIRAFVDLLIFAALMFILGSFSQPPHGKTDAVERPAVHREAN